MRDHTQTSHPTEKTAMSSMKGKITPSRLAGAEASPSP